MMVDHLFYFVKPPSSIALVAGCGRGLMVLAIGSAASPGAEDVGLYRTKTGWDRGGCSVRTRMWLSDRRLELICCAER